MRTATVFGPLLVGGALVATTAVAWGNTANCASPPTAKSCCAARDAANPAPAATAATTPAPAQAGMRAYLDPETGLIGGMGPVDPAEVQDVQAAPVLREEVLPDGSVMLDLQGTMQDYYIMQLDADGNRVVRCVQDAAKALAETPAPAAKAVK
jgi:hypothetical protein